MMRFHHKNSFIFLCLFIFCVQDGVFGVSRDDDIFSLLGMDESGRKQVQTKTIPDLVAVAGKLLEYKLPEDAFKTQTAPYEVCTV
jgi:hypothetical protein